MLTVRTEKLVMVIARRALRSPERLEIRVVGVALVAALGNYLESCLA
jgi:hypothetical protein